MTVITIRRNVPGHCWTGEIKGGPLEAEVREAFGTNVIPLPYTAEADAEFVLNAQMYIHRADPSISVVIPILEMIPLRTAPRN